jgi:putative FmdB family regulatory protein
MPLYEYVCDACGHRFEVIRKFSDAPLDRCPKCGGPIHKLQSAPAFHLKGTGWYITDYGRKDSGSSGGESKSGSDSGDSKAETKTDGKSETKTDGKSETKTDAKSETKTDAAPASSETKTTKTNS